MRNRSIKKHQFGCLFVVLLPVIAGCSDTSKGVSGSVSYQGEPIKRGTITFLPVGGTTGVSVRADIEDGKYLISSETGVMPGGTYRVEITAVRKTGRTLEVKQGLVPLPANKSSVSYEEEESFLPEKYNAQSVLKVEFSESVGSEQQDFDLE